MLIRWLERVLRWLGWTPPIEVQTKWVEPSLDPAMRASVERWVKKYEENRGVTSEYKRHQVYAHVLKEFPGMPHHEVGLAIELVIWRLRGGYE